jgi:hypothetical protein
MFTKFWNWLNREDWRERYPDGRLVSRSPFPGNVVESLADALPIWLQRLGVLLFQFFTGAVILFVVWRLLAG